MYYIVEKNYVGRNQTQDQYVDANEIEIKTSPAITNSSHEVCLEGWCGSDGDWAVNAHGVYASIKEARAAIAQKFGDVRDSWPSGDSFEIDDEEVVEIYKPGKFVPMSPKQTGDWSYDCIQADIKMDTTDERIAELVIEYEDDANSNGGTLHGELEYFMKDRRQELRHELEAEA